MYMMQFKTLRELNGLCLHAEKTVNWIVMSEKNLK